MIRTALLSAALILSTPALAALSPAETKMVGAVDAAFDADVALLERMVNQNSGTNNIEGVTKVAEMLRPELEALGFKVRWIPQGEVQRAGHLFAEHKGKPGTKRMLLIGHMDTVFEPDSPFQRFSREGSVGKGPGAADNKGGVVVMLSALKAMKAAGTLKDANIVVALTGDEEEAGKPRTIARRDLIAEGKRADVALDFEGLVRLNGQDMGSIARRSSNTWVLKTSGETGHSSSIFSERMGDGAVFEMSRILARFRAELPEPSLTFNVGLLAGGERVELDGEGVRATATGKSNIIPPTAVAVGEFRSLSNEQTERVKAKMIAIAAENSAKTKSELVFNDPYPPMAPTEGNRALLARLNGVNSDLGLPAMPELDPLRRGAGDVGFVAADLDSLAGLGVAGGGDHTDREFVDLTSIPLQAKRAAILMSRISKEKAR
ncbi:M20/M25/M40 family metallo-hydrolase [Sandaracinobacter sp.]|uniref:M20/M25/M40 family metallo-hydrolase n=1 Tax=Sandaracinobacter sp. TaxID=2487581 RepID=UPI0035B43EE1